MSHVRLEGGRKAWRGAGCSASLPEATAQAAYEADLARAPNYSDGSPRARWGELSTIARWSWARPEAESDLEMARRRA
jgi:hypothetical protein